LTSVGEKRRPINHEALTPEKNLLGGGGGGEHDSATQTDAGPTSTQR